MRTNRDDMDVDLSVLRKPIATSVTGFVGVMRAYDNGTAEMRRILEQECDVIYECKVCRNIFRDVANLMTHKRLYCKAAFNSKRDFHFPDHGFLDQNISTVIEQENKTISVESKKSYTDSLPKNLGGLLAKMRMKQVVAGTLKKSDYYELVNSKVTLEDVMQKKHLLLLEEIPETSAAVYQTVKTDDGGEVGAIDKAEAIKVEVDEVHKLSTNNDTVVGPDGKALTLREFRETCDKDAFEIGSLDELLMLCHYDDEAETEPHECAICDARFETEKTLIVHIKLKHISSTKVYQCPSCSNTFSQASLVIKHLSNDHKKSMKKIRSMRETIHKRHMRMDEVQIKGPSRELNRLQTQKEREEAENNRAYLENVQNFDNNNQSMCTYCKKTFDRKAVMTSHMVNCRSKFEKTIVGPSSNAKPVSEKSTAAAVYPSSKRGPKLSAGSNQVKENGTKDKELLQDENSSSTVISTDGSTTSSHMLENNNNSNSTRQEGGGGSLDGDHSNASSSAKRKRKLNLAGLKADASKKVKKDSGMPSDISGLLEKDLWNGRERDESYFSFEDAQETRDTNAYKKRFPCETCNRSFSTPSNLKRHKQMVHYFNNQYQCKLCPYQAGKKFDAIEHLRTMHKMEQEDHELKTFLHVKNEVSSSEQLDLDLEDALSNQERPASLSGRYNSGTNSPTSNEPGNFNQILPPSSKGGEGLQGSASATATPTVTPPPVPRRGRGRPKGSFRTKKAGRPTSGPRAIDRGTRSESTRDSDSSDFMEGKKKAVAVPVPSVSPEGQNNSGASTSSSSRPIRNRTKPKDKDFVYDLFNLEKDFIYEDAIDSALSESMLTSNSSSSAATTTTSTPSSCNGAASEQQPPPRAPKKRMSVTEKILMGGGGGGDTPPADPTAPNAGVVKRSVGRPKTKYPSTNPPPTDENNFYGSYQNLNLSSANSKAKEVNWTINGLIPTRIIQHRHSIDRPRLYNSLKKEEARRNSIDIMSLAKVDLKEKRPSSNCEPLGVNGNLREHRMDSSNTDILKEYVRADENSQGVMEEAEEALQAGEEYDNNITLDRNFVADTLLSPPEEHQSNSGIVLNGWSLEEIISSEMREEEAQG